jgi:hypothetical protein
MTSFRLRRIRRFRFNLPQRIAAALLLLFLAQGLWLAARQPMTDRDFQFALRGRQMWTGTGSATEPNTRFAVRDGILAYCLAGLPLTLDLWAQRGLDSLSKQPDGEAQSTVMDSPQEMRAFHWRMMRLLLLVRLPFLLAGLVLGAGLWWVARRLYGNHGGYLALALYCFSPAMLRASTKPGSEILAALAIYGGVYTCIGVAHAMQGPRRKWRPRILLLMALFAVAATSHWAALALAALLGSALMLWVAEGRRKLVFPIVLLALGGAIVGAWACYGFSLQSLSFFFTASAGFSCIAAMHVFATPANAGVLVAAAAALVLYLVLRRARYFGNTAPLLCVLVLLPLQLSGAPGAWVLPFLLTFVGGVFADAFEEPRGRWMQAAAGAIVLLQAVFCVLDLTGLL